MTELRSRHNVFGQFKGVDFWGYDQVHDVMAAFCGRPDVLFRPDD